ncbi:hypothetical protein MAR_004542 [Mya arenaria]|uniref:Uncharacterized protein n=1 Tax=Mya arenaria TaxID=6604 RepID=A0ABY7EWV4_MYAAR|nr:hypothetical protein MAR_004542 [Mya arenaria]
MMCIIWTLVLLVAIIPRPGGGTVVDLTHTYGPDVLYPPIGPGGTADMFNFTIMHRGYEPSLDACTEAPMLTRLRTTHRVARTCTKFPWNSLGRRSCANPASFYPFGTDAHSCDPGQNSNRNRCHEEFLPNGVILLEFVANLDRMPPVNSTIFLGPMKMRDGSGGPCRILAIYGEDIAGVSAGNAMSFSILLSTSALVLNLLL